MQTVYINAAARVGADFEVPAAGPCNRFEEPDYTKHIPKRSLRRIDRVSRFALHAAHSILEETGCREVDGIIMGVGQTIGYTVDGMLRKLISHQEQQTNPTNFMNGMLSTAAGQIALQMSCNGYTNTHTQRGFTFEAALMDASLLLQDDPTANFLVGGAEEVHPTYQELSENYGHVGASRTTGVERRVGEGAAMFMVSAQANDMTQARLLQIFTTYLTETDLSVWSAGHHREILYGSTPPEVDVVVSGRPAGSEAQSIYDQLLAPYAGKIPIIDYKKNLGESATASAHGLYRAVECLNSRATRRVLVINNYGERYLSAFVLDRPE